MERRVFDPAWLSPSLKVQNQGSEGPGRLPSALTPTIYPNFHLCFSFSPQHCQDRKKLFILLIYLACCLQPHRT